MEGLRFLGIAAVLGIALMCVWNEEKMKVMAENCQNDLQALEIECLIFMAKNSPSTQNPNDRCCNVIRSVNVPCCCNNLNQSLVFPPGVRIADLISWPKVLHCFSFCGRPFAPGTKCGSFTVPP